jgi:hypothetical protein
MRPSEEVIKQFNSLLKNSNITDAEKVAAIKKFSYEELSNVPVYLLKDLRDKLANGKPSDNQMTNGLIGLLQDWTLQLLCKTKQCCKED